MRERDGKNKGKGGSSGADAMAAADRPQVEIWSALWREIRRLPRMNAAGALTAPAAAAATAR